MLEKQRNTLIKKAFESAKIIAPGTGLTALEIDDAAYTLNCMLQGWSNEGFHLFNMKTGYMPLLTKQNEYSMSTEAYSQFSSVPVLSVESIGATKVKVSSVKDIAPLQKVAFLNNTLSEFNRVSEIDYENGVLTLEKPVNMSVYSGDDVFFGNFSFAFTEVKQYGSDFSSLELSGYTSLPSVGDIMYVNVSNSWRKVSVSAVNTAESVVFFAHGMGAGQRVSKPQVLFGSTLEKTTLSGTYEVSARKLNTKALPFSPVSLSINSGNYMDDMITVEKSDSDSIVLSEPVSLAVLNLMGQRFVDGKEIHQSKSLLQWHQIPQNILNEVIDWGSVNDVPASGEDDWGYVKDIVSGELDFGTLTGSAKIISYAKSATGEYVSVSSGTNAYLLYKDYSGAWVSIDDGSEVKLFTHNGVVYAYNMPGGVAQLSGNVISYVYSGVFVEKIIPFMGKLYLVSAPHGNVRVIAYTENFLTFSDQYSIPADTDLSNAVEFKGKLYCGFGKTYVSSDMKSFADASVYAENRAVIGDFMQNFNSEAVCSYTKDGVNFYPMPSVSASVSSAFNVNGCTFISVYGKVGLDGIVGSQVFSVNEFVDAWTPQTTITGKVSHMYESDDVLYIVSDTEVLALYLSVDYKAQDTEAYIYGSPIGRPQELMNVVKYGLNTSTQLSMEEMALKDYSQLPHIKADGEPVSYCFFREASDGKLMVWGTPRKFGEYLKFTYVEPIALLDNARSIPDIPDEYVGAVIDGLAAELAHEYAAPVERVQLLQAKADASKQIALLHDNENSSYVIEPNSRGL